VSRPIARPTSRHARVTADLPLDGAGPRPGRSEFIRDLRPRAVFRKRWRPGPWLAAFAALALAGCTSAVSSRARLSPTTDLGGTPIVAEVERSCRLGDCRVQRVRMVLPDGEVLEGDLTFIPPGLTVPGGTWGGGLLGVPAVGIAGVPSRRAAELTLQGNRGTRLSCELVFVAGARQGSGLCRSATGVSYLVDL
jgi:hypothetical protein